MTPTTQSKGYTESEFLADWLIGPDGKRGRMVKRYECDKCHFDSTEETKMQEHMVDGRHPWGDKTAKVAQ